MSNQPVEFAYAFGDVLFDELKQIAIRRAGIAALCDRINRLETITDNRERSAIKTEIKASLPRATASVRDLAYVVLSHAQALRSVAKQSQATCAGGENNAQAGGTDVTEPTSAAALATIAEADGIDRKLDSIIANLKKAVAPAGIAAIDGVAPKLATVITGFDQEAYPTQKPALAGGSAAPARECESPIGIHEVFHSTLKSNAQVDAIRDALRDLNDDPMRLRSEEAVGDPARSTALEMDLVGLAFSGGGIRSATFNLGILQGLASLRLLGKFDYLSTVSGGGYIGAWLAAWIHREGDIGNVEKQLNPMRIDQAEATRGWLDLTSSKHDSGEKAAETPAKPANRTMTRLHEVVEEEPEPIYHLRRYSNYLSPRTGLLSVDTWSMLSTYGRNLLLNQLILLPAAAVLILVPRIFLLLFQQELEVWPRAFLGAAMFLLAGVSLVTMYLFLKGRRLASSANAGAESAFILERLSTQLRPELGWFLAFVVCPLFLATIPFSYLFSFKQQRYLNLPILDHWLNPGTPFAQYVPSAILFGLVAGFFRLIWFLISWLPRPARTADARAEGGSTVDHQRPREIGFAESTQRALISFVSSFASASSLYAVMSWARTLLNAAPVWRVPAFVSFGPPVAVLAILLSVAIESGLLGAMEEEEVREWRASLGAYLMIIAVAWAMLFGISLCGPFVMVAAGPRIGAALSTGWLASSIAGAIAGGSAKTSGGHEGVWEFLVQFAPPIFVVGLLMVVSMMVCLVEGVLPNSVEPFDRSAYWVAMSSVQWPRLIAEVVVAFAVAGIVSWRLNVNLFSLHAFYANRLVRCYLGASRPDDSRPPGRPHYAPSNCPAPPRNPNLVTGFDRDDDFPLKQLKAFSSHDGAKQRGYSGPFPLINTAMNLVAGKELAWQERMAESFVLTPLYSGCKSTGYRKMDVTEPTEQGGERRPGYGGDLRLGTAISISGAAASPNMGYHSSPAVTFLMTVFNARLGWWLGNPAREKWFEPGPRFGFYLFKELFGRTNANSRYVYLSDGGHFENLGVYELIRRRCRYIVACDAGEDPALAFWDLGSLVRKCREDLGVRIEIDIAPLLKQEHRGRSRWHCSIGKIRYDDIDVSAIPGVLLYIKPSLTGDEPTDIRNYVVGHPKFPHQSTSNQFFSESQFESYRALGEHIAQEVFRDAAAKRGDESAGSLFSALHRRWFPPPPDFDANFLKSVDAYIEIQGQLRTDPHLGRLSTELYPEVTSSAEGYAERDRAEVHVIGQVLQVMENVWLAVGLDNFSDHPMNRGWMNWFRRWSGSSVFQRHWPILRGEFGQDFVRFAEKQLNLRVARSDLIPCPTDETVDPVFEAAVLSLDDEYVLEWPSRPWPGGEKARPDRVKKTPDAPMEKNRGGLVELFAHTRAQARWVFQRNEVPAWLIPEPVPPGAAEAMAPWNGRVCGIILAWKTQDDINGHVLEFFVWLRGPYRTLGIGRAHVENAIARMRDWLEPSESGLVLRVDYPMREPTTPAMDRADSAGDSLVTAEDSSHSSSGSKDRWQSMIWLSFFQGLGFRKKRQESPAQEVLSLYRDAHQSSR
jgi:Patatin-like phospholipase